MLLSTVISSVTAFAQTAPPPPPPPPPVDAAPPPPPLPPPPPPPEPSDWKFALHGIAGVSVYVQDTPTFVLNGQGPLLPLSKPQGGLTTGADIRQSRFNFSVAGPKIFAGATPKAVLELDLFGLNSPGGYGEVSVYSRVRLAYAELNWGNDVLRFGQDHELIFAMIPDAMGHMAFPATYFNGLIGWREPGIGYFHTIPIGESKLELALQAIKSDWENPTDFGDSTVNDLNVDLGQLSGWLGGEARVKYSSEILTAYVAGHYNRVEGTHAGDLAVPPAAAAIPNRNWDVIAGVAGFRLNVWKLSLLGSGYVGKNLGPLLGALLQFPTTNDVNEWGLWGQFIFNITHHIAPPSSRGRVAADGVGHRRGGRRARRELGVRRHGALPGRRVRDWAGVLQRGRQERRQDRRRDGPEREPVPAQRHVLLLNRPASGSRQSVTSEPPPICGRPTSTRRSFLTTRPTPRSSDLHHQTILSA